MIIGDGIMLGAGGETASIFVTGLSKTDNVTATHKIPGKVPNPEWKSLPDGYTQLEYIRSTGYEYISMNLSGNAFDSFNIHINANYSDQLQDQQGLIGSVWVMVGFLNRTSESFWGSMTNSSPFINGDITLNWDGTTITINDFSTTMAKQTTSAETYLFACNGTYPDRRIVCSMYKSTISNEGVLVRDFVPCKRNSDNAVGMYDLVTKKFFGNSGTGAFIAGAEVPQYIDGYVDGKTIIGKWIQKPNPAAPGLPDGYTELEYIEGDGNSYIDTGVLSTSEMSMYFKFGYEDSSILNSNGAELAHGSVDSVKSGFDIPIIGGPSIGFRPYYNEKLVWATFNIPGTNEFEVQQIEGSTNRNVVLNNTLVNTTTDTYSVSNTITFFKSGSSDASTNGIELRLYSAIFSNYDVILNNFVPCKRNSDNAVGMYDLVSNTFFGNAGTGTFTAGPEVPQTIDGFLIDKIKEYGTWPVTATDGTNTATSDIVVDSAIEYAVEMSYVSWLYKDGNECEYVTGGWVNGGYNGGAGTFSKDNDHLTVKHAGNGAQLARTSNKIDLTPYNTVFAEVITSTDNYSAAAIRVKNTPGYNDGSEGTVTEGAKLTVKTIIQTDVSTLSGEYYIKPAIYWGSYAYFYKIWLE